LTIKGDLRLMANMQLGRSSNTPGLVTTGRVNQLSGAVRVNNDAIDIAATDTSMNVTGENYGSGTYDYRGGILEVSIDGGSGLRLSPSSSTVGPAGIGRFIMHNPDTPGYVRTYDYNAASGAGTSLAGLADGVNTGVGITEFHFENGGTRPIQVPRNLIINNGLTESGSGLGGIRSPRLTLVLDEAPTVDGGGIPQNLGLFDVNFSSVGGTSTTGAGTDGDFFDSLDGSDVLIQGDTVSAMFAGSTYNWTISYTGNITWTDPDAGIVGSITDTGGVDVVLKGLSSIIVPAGVAGDFNDDDKVDAADYVVWRKNTANSPLPNDNGLATQAERFNLWRGNFGEMAGSGSGANTGAIPEPGALVLVLVGAIGLAFRRRR
jgi:hypothetical protein